MFRTLPPSQRTITISVVACLLAVLAASLVDVITAAAGHRSPLIQDPEAYAALISEVRAGGVPYVDVAVEHLPMALVPMVVAKALDAVAPGGFTLWFALLMIASTLAVVAAYERIDAGKGLVVLALMAPLLPLTLFRVEPWVLALAAMGVLTGTVGRWKLSVTFATIATLAKAWPGVVFGLPWRGGRKGAAVTGSIIAASMLVPIVFSPGFRAARSFRGIHTETIVGSATLLVRHLIGVDPGIIQQAGAAYVSTGSWTVVANATFGIPFILAGVALALRSPGGRQLLVSLGVCVLGVMLASPLLSAQFVSWLAIFLVFSTRRHQLLYIAVGTVTVSTIAVWAPRNAVWAAATLGRNMALMILGAMLIAHALRTASEQPPSHGAT